MAHQRLDDTVRSSASARSDTVNGEEEPWGQRCVLCRPHGGLNDTLGVIGTCWRYAEATGRTLVVDADRSAFCADFAEYFEPRDPAADVRFDATPELLTALNELSCYPAVVQGRLDTYSIAIQLHETLSHLEFRLPVEAETETPLYLDFDAVYDEAVVVHELYGGMPGAVDVLSRVRFTPWVQRVLRHRLKALPGGPYVGVHVRNSDLQSDFTSFLRAHAAELAGCTVVVCSDDGAVLANAVELLPESTVISVSEVPVSDGVPYQRPFHASPVASRKLAIDTLVDLLALAGATSLLAPEIVNRNANVSGFSVLARELAARPDVVDGLFS